MCRLWNDERGRKESVKCCYWHFFSFFSSIPESMKWKSFGRANNSRGFQSDVVIDFQRITFSEDFMALFFTIVCKLSITHGSFGPFSPQIRSVFIRRLLHFVIRQNVWQWRVFLIIVSLLSCSIFYRHRTCHYFTLFIRSICFTIFSSSNPTQAIGNSSF